MISRLSVFDFDGTLINSPEPERGKILWSERTGRPYPYAGWWGRPESLDLDVFDIKPFPTILNQLRREIATPNTYVMVLTSRMEKLRPQVEAILDKNNIHVDKIDMKRAEGNKGIKILRYVEQMPDLKVINVYDDRETDLVAYEAIRSEIPNGIEFNIYAVDNDKLVLTETSRSGNLLYIIMEEIKKIF